jgi:hypothetical protein
VGCPRVTFIILATPYNRGVDPDSFSQPSPASGTGRIFAQAQSARERGAADAHPPHAGRWRELSRSNDRPPYHCSDHQPLEESVFERGRDWTDHIASRPATAETHARTQSQDSGQDTGTADGWQHALEPAQNGGRDRRRQGTGAAGVERSRSETASDGALSGLKRSGV